MRVVAELRAEENVLSMHGIVGEVAAAAWRRLGPGGRILGGRELELQLGQLLAHLGQGSAGGSPVESGPGRPSLHLDAGRVALRAPQGPALS